MIFKNKINHGGASSLEYKRLLCESREVFL